MRSLRVQSAHYDLSLIGYERASQITLNVGHVRRIACGMSQKIDDFSVISIGDRANRDASFQIEC